MLRWPDSGRVRGLAEDEFAQVASKTFQLGFNPPDGAPEGIKGVVLVQCADRSIGLLHHDGIRVQQTGGGAFLEFVEGKVLPSVEILESRAKA